TVRRQFYRRCYSVLWTAWAIAFDSSPACMRWQGSRDCAPSLLTGALTDFGDGLTTRRFGRRSPKPERRRGMKILRSPLDFNEQDISELQTRAVGESPFLEYKRDLDLSHDGKVELLKDVSAMANADGGVTIYGVAQDESGAPSGLPGLTIQEPDKLQVQIAQVLMDGLDPPIPGVVHRAIPRTDGTWFYVIRVPASHLAPHMITIKTTKPRFYMRVNTVNVPVSATQIKEVALRQEHAERSALAFVRQRLEWNTRFP